MKMFWFFLFSVLTVSSSQAQEEYMTQTLNLKVYVKLINDVQPLLDKTIEETGSRILSSTQGSLQYNTTANSLRMTIWSSSTGFVKLQQTIKSLGLVRHHEITTVNNADILASLEMELDHLNKKKQSYESEINRIDASSEKHGFLWDELRTIEDRIFETERSILEKKQQTSNYVIELEVIEESYAPFEDAQDVQFVNMPGFEYAELRIENPLNTVSHKTYRGGMVKYLFTKGKSYVRFGVLRSGQDGATPEEIEELFFYSFGQDFYPRYFGRGARSFANLYTGYSTGGVFATADDRRKNVFFLMPHIGLELYKTRFILWDTQAGYFIPFYQNRNFRGIAGHMSFNFVF
ncbi:MAG TPA: hypothetical protein PKA52_08235 [bacterium]|nr:hypothetical protein [bacterium]HNO11286.1 hypothetical protein [bacterium]